MIGVIGGNGVAATNRLCQLIEEMCVQNGAYRDAHHPEMIIWQATQVPSRSMFLEGRGESFIPGYVDCGIKLKNCGCTELCMCCNTAHYAINELQEQIGLPFIDIIAEVAKRVRDTGCQRVAIMCSDGCRLTGLYNRINEFAKNVTIIYPDEIHQKMVTKGICNAKNKHRYSDEMEDQNNPTVIFSNVCDWFVSTYQLSKNDCIIAGCTDINNVFFHTSFKGVSYIDSLRVLAEAIIQKHLVTL